MGDFLVEVSEECEETKLFIDGSELVVGKDSFFKCEDLFSVHSGVEKFLLVSRFNRTLCST
jgi:hypothetical protein